jgi:predicted  nucleic acid-binding Zn-ribbon protein
MSTIDPTFLTHEGFTYLTFNGEFFKGCKRCGGSGFFSHNGEHDRCYSCDNTSAKLGEHLADEAAALKWCHERAVRRAQRERKAEAVYLAAQAQRDARVEKMMTEEPGVYALLKSIDDAETDAYATGDYSKVSKSAFLRQMAGRLFNASNKHEFSPNMIVALRRSAEQARERAAADAERADVPEGRIQVTGVVRSVKWVENDFGGAYKALVEHESGFKVYGTVPSSVMEGHTTEELVGRTMSFTATVEASQNDKSFGFYKRPTKATVS